ncbi:unannotated protein [freshwater metagenome]|uniref:Unannotated protein n=1 Tax=freshwater metagenome TaxID=449393 RepID=A0A6J7ATK4_9ZZZZ
MGVNRDLDSPGAECNGVDNVHDKWVIGGATFDRIDTCHGSRITGQGTEPIDSLGRHRRQVATGDCSRGYARVSGGNHVPIQPNGKKVRWSALKTGGGERYLFVLGDDFSGFHHDHLVFTGLTRDVVEH